MNRILTATTLLVLLAGAMSAPGDASPRVDTGLETDRPGGRTPRRAEFWMRRVAPEVLRKAEYGPTEFILVLAEQADVSGARRLGSREAKGRHVFERLRDVAFRTQPAVLRTLDELGAEHRAFWITNAVWVRGDRATLQHLAGIPAVERVIEDVELRLRPPEVQTARDVPDRDIEWNIIQIRAHEVWARGIDGAGVVIGGMDTGVDPEHPVLKNQYRGWDGNNWNNNYNWHDAIHEIAAGCRADSPVPCDDDGHGTHTMGTMVGSDGGSNNVGVAPGAQWIACRCWEPDKRTYISYVTECFQWMLAPTNLLNERPDPDKAPHVFNNSWICEPDEGCADPEILLTIVQNLRAAGVMVVAAAGNNGPDCSTVRFPPAIYDESFSVAATDFVGNVAGFSSRGPVTIDGSQRLKPDISAPGVNVRSADTGGGYLTISGTSMAAPHVAGVVALMISARPELAGRIDLIEDIIQRTAVRRTSSQVCGGLPGGAIPNPVYGYGRADALAAYWESLIVDIPPLTLPGNEDPLPPGVPNPFRRETTISYSIETVSPVRIEVFDVSGRRVRTLVDRSESPPGTHAATWDGCYQNGSPAPDGVYFYRLSTDPSRPPRSGRLVLIRER